MRRLAFLAFLLVLYSSLVTHHSSLAFAQIITTVAGGDWVFRGDGGRATAAALGPICGIAVDFAGNVFAADGGNHVVIKVSADGILTVVAGNGIQGASGDGGPATRASLTLNGGGHNPVAVDALGSVFFVDWFRMRKVDRAGVITTVAGSGEIGQPGFSPDGTPATAAKLSTVYGLALGPAGHIFFSESNYVRKIGANGTITTVAGNGERGFSGDGGPATTASLRGPAGLAFDAAGNLYVADEGNDRVRKVSPDGFITTVAGAGCCHQLTDGDPATSGWLPSPHDVASDPAGNLYIAQSGQIRKVTADGIITSVAGKGYPWAFSGDGGPATLASIGYGESIAVDAAGTLFIADDWSPDGNKRVRKVGRDGVISTLAGNGAFRFAGDGGPAPSASLSSPSDVAIDSAGNIYVADTHNHRIRKVRSNGIIETLAGNGSADFSGDGGAATTASLNCPTSLARDSAGNLYVSDDENDRVRKVTPSGVITTVAGNPSLLGLGDGGPATSANLLWPNGLAVDRTGNLYLSDSGHNRVRKVSLDGSISTFAGTGVKAFSGDGGPAASASLDFPTDLTIDASGNVCIADFANRRVRRVSLAGTIATAVGNGLRGSSGDGGQAASASIDMPSGMVTDSLGNLYVADSGSHNVRKVSPSGVITTFAGSFIPFSFGDGGPASMASLAFPRGLALDTAGNLYIADSWNHRIRMVLATAPLFSLAPRTLNFSSVAGAPLVAPQLVAATSTVNGLAWGASTSAPWLTVSEASGAAPGLIPVSVNATSLGPGTYRSMVTVTAPLASNPVQNIAVDLTVLPPGDARPELDSTSIVLEATTASENPPVRTLRLSNAGGGTLNWTADVQTLNGGNWLRLSPMSGTSSAGSPAIIQVRANAAGLPPGVYSGLISISSPSSPDLRTVPVDLIITQVTYMLSLTQSALRFTAVEGEPVAAQKLGIVNTGQGTMNWTARAETVNGGSWLSVSPASGQSEAGSVIVSQAEAAVNTRGLRAGTYAGFIRVDAPGANNSPRLVTVVLTVLPAGSKTGTRLSPSGLIFSLRAGGGSPSSQLVNLTTSNPGQVSAAGQAFTINGGDWLKVLPTNLAVSASDPRTIVVQPDVGKLSPGEYRASLTYMFDDGSPAQAVDIYFLVVGSTVSASSFSEAAAAGCTARKLIAVDRSLGPNFAAQVGAASGLEVQVADDCGNAVSDATVVANFSNGDAPVSLSYLRDGIYTGTWRPGKAGATVTVTLRASLGSLPSLEILRQGKVEEGAKIPAVFPGGVVHAASFAPNGALAPGSIISVFGANLASSPAGASSLPLPKTLAGASLQVGGYEVPLFYSSGGQINAQLPFELPPNSRPQLIVKGADFVTVPETITVATARPGIFTTTQDGKGQGVIMDVGNRLADAANPAKAGDVVVVYCTGLGATNPAVRSGEAAPASPLAKVVTPVTVTIGGQPATVQYAGLTPGYAGLYQVNVQIPGGVTPGASVSLVISQDGVPSNTVTLALR